RQALLTTGSLAVVGAVAGVLVIGAGVGTGADRLTVVPASPAPDQGHSAAGCGRQPLHPSPSAASLPAGPSTAIATGPGQTSQQGAGRSGGQPAPSDSPTPYAPPRRHSAA